MKAITIRQPWARAVAAGIKTVENRGRNTNHRGLIAIHSSRTPDLAGDTDRRILHWYGADARVAAPAGAVLAVANLLDCHERAEHGCCAPWGDEWYPTPRGVTRAWHLLLGDVRPLDEPVYARGAVMVPWTLPEDVAAQVQAHLDRQAAA